MENFELTIIISLFSLGLFGGFTHCIGMCGPFVLTQVNNRLENIRIEQASEFKKLQGLALIPYHLGRATTYSLIGGISAFLASNLKNLSGFKQLSGFLLLTAALIFISVIFKELKLKIALPFKINLIQNLSSSWLKNNRLILFIKSKAQHILGALFLKPYNINGYFLGILLGFIPCGLLYGAIASAAALNGFLNGALALFFFTIGTIPALFITAYGGYWLRGKWENKLKFFTRIILLLNGATLLIMAFGLIFNKI